MDAWFRTGVQTQEESNGGESQHRPIIYFAMRITNHRARVNIRASYISIGGSLVPVLPRSGTAVGTEPAHVSWEPAIWPLTEKNKTPEGFMLSRLKVSHDVITPCLEGFQICPKR